MRNDWIKLPSGTFLNTSKINGVFPPEGSARGAVVFWTGKQLELTLCDWEALAEALEEPDAADSLLKAALELQQGLQGKATGFEGAEFMSDGPSFPLGAGLVMQPVRLSKPSEDPA